jgi:ABC-type branched-subunit amino acid transport system ATPase component
MATVRLRSLRKSFGAVDVIKGVEIDIQAGEFVVFVGPTGCGTSTLLRMIAGLEDITSSMLEIDGATVNDKAPKDRGIAMVFQTYAVFPHMTVREDVAFGLTTAGASKTGREEKVAFGRASCATPIPDADRARGRRAARQDRADRAAWPRDVVEIGQAFDPDRAHLFPPAEPGNDRH